MSTTNETGFDDVASAGSLHPTPEGDHLRYLLTAYLFENLSDAGRREVENHLRECDACRAELDELLRTRTLLESVLGEPPGYSFDERRRERILAAAGERRPGWLGALRRRLPMAVAAAMVLCVLGGFLLMMTTSSRMGYESASRDRSLARAPQKSTGFEASQSAPGLEVFDDRAASVEEKLSFDMNGRPAPDTTAGAVTPGLSTPSRVEYHAVTAPEAPTDGDVSAPTVEFGQQWRGPEKPNAMQFYNAALENEKQDGARSADGRFRVDGVVGGGEEGRTRVWLEDQLVTEATGVGGGAAGAHGDRYSRDGEAAAKELGASPGGTDPRWRSYGAMKSPETSTAGVAPPASGPAPEAERVADTQWHARTRTENLRQNADDDFAQRIDQGVDSFADLATPQPQEPAVQRPTGTFEKNLARAGEYRERGKASAADEQIRRELELETAELAKKTDTLWERGVAEGQ